MEGVGEGILIVVPALSCARDCVVVIVEGDEVLIHVLEQGELDSVCGGQGVQPVGSIPAFRLMVFAASTVFGVKIAVASPDAAGVESPEAVDSVDSGAASEAAMLSVDVVELELLPPHLRMRTTTNAADRTRAKTFSVHSLFLLM